MRLDTPAPPAHAQASASPLRKRKLEGPPEVPVADTAAGGEAAPKVRRLSSSASSSSSTSSSTSSSSSSSASPSAATTATPGTAPTTTTTTTPPADGHAAAVGSRTPAPAHSTPSVARVLCRTPRRAAVAAPGTPGGLERLRHIESPSEITEGLFVGSTIVARNRRVLLGERISHALTLDQSDLAAHFARHGIVHRSIEFPQAGCVLGALEECLAFVRDALRAGGRVLVHDFDGCTAAPAVAVGYLLAEHLVPSLEAAEEVLCRKRPLCELSPEHAAQLRLFAGEEWRVLSSGSPAERYALWMQRVGGAGGGGAGGGGGGGGGGNDEDGGVTRQQLRKERSALRETLADRERELACVREALEECKGEAGDARRAEARAREALVLEPEKAAPCGSVGGDVGENQDDKQQKSESEKEKEKVELVAVVQALRAALAEALQAAARAQREARALRVRLGELEQDLSEEVAENERLVPLLRTYEERVRQKTRQITDLKREQVTNLSTIINDLDRIERDNNAVREENRRLRETQALLKKCMQQTDVL